MASNYTAVIEMRDGQVLGVELFGANAAEHQPEEHAVAIAKEATGYDEEEIRTHIYHHGRHEEGDWSVHVAEAFFAEGQEPAR